MVFSQYDFLSLNLNSVAGRMEGVTEENGPMAVLMDMVSRLGQMELSGMTDYGKMTGQCAIASEC